MSSYASAELISSTDLSKKFGSYLSMVRDHSVEKLAVLRNNKIEAVMLSKESYEHLLNALQTLEAQQVGASIQQGLADAQAGRTHSLDTLWDALDD